MGELAHALGDAEYPSLQPLRRPSRAVDPLCEVLGSASSGAEIRPLAGLRAHRSRRDEHDDDDRNEAAATPEPSARAAHGPPSAGPLPRLRIGPGKGG